MNEAAVSGDILLATINAKWIHPSLALRLLKANLGLLENSCTIIEFALRQPLGEKTEPILAARPRILGLSVSIWNHTATLELLKNLRTAWKTEQRPIVVLGGPEVSYLPQEAEIFRYADYCIRGEGEIAFRELCETILNEGDTGKGKKVFSETGNNLSNTEVLSEMRKNFLSTVFINGGIVEPSAEASGRGSPPDVAAIKSGYRLYTDEDLRKKLIYVEASRGCPFGCEFCLSAATSAAAGTHSSQVREFPLEPFFAEMDDLIQRGVSSHPLTFKFLDRTFNLNIDRAQRIMEFFLGKIEEQTKATVTVPLVVHFEMVPSRFPPELIHTLARFPTGTLRLEIGLQTLNPGVSARIGRPLEPERDLEPLRLLREKTNAIIHADLIAGLPGEDMASFGRGFDRLWGALSVHETAGSAEIQLGILKLLPGAAIARHTDAFGMRYNPLPPYEVTETAAMPAGDLDRIKNFARFWELIVNRGLLDIGTAPVFDRFMALADSLEAHFGRSWGIDKNELKAAADKYATINPII